MDLPEKQGLYDPRNEHDSCGVGFVADIKGRKSHAIVREGLSILVNLDHRGAVGADPLVGDGAGCLIQIPDALLRDWARQSAVDLPQPGHYAVAMCFLPQDEKARAFAIKRLEHFVKVEKQKLVGWRDVPTDITGLGKAVIERMPVIKMAIVGRGPSSPTRTPSSARSWRSASRPRIRSSTSRRSTSCPACRSSTCRPSPRAPWSTRASCWRRRSRASTRTCAIR